MTKEQVQQMLDELNEIKPEQLKGNSKRLFEAIMQIADERDKIEQKLKGKDEELEMLKDFKEIAESKVGELSPIRTKKNKSVIK